MIYADNAATTKMSDAAVKTLTDLLSNTYGNPSSLYEFGQKAKEVLEQARRDIADSIGAQPIEAEAKLTIRQSSQLQRWVRSKERNTSFQQLLNIMQFFTH